MAKETNEDTRQIFEAGVDIFPGSTVHFDANLDSLVDPTDVNGGPTAGTADSIKALALAKDAIWLHMFRGLSLEVSKEAAYEGSTAGDVRSAFSRRQAVMQWTFMAGAVIAQPDGVIIGTDPA
jgi:hypothetical protein